MISRNHTTRLPFLFSICWVCGICGESLILPFIRQKQKCVCNLLQRNKNNRFSVIFLCKFKNELIFSFLDSTALASYRFDSCPSRVENSMFCAKFLNSSRVACRPLLDYWPIVPKNYLRQRSSFMPIVLK